MISNNHFIVKYCYHGIRDKLVTQITNILELSEYLKKTPQEVNKYFASSLNTHTELYENTLKIKGLLSKPIIDRLINEMLETSINNINE
jgi:hypothetical protein